MIYLDNAATSYPKPPAVIEAVTAALRDAGGNPGRSGHPMALKAGRLVIEGRLAVARFLGIPDPNRLFFTLNCTDSLNLAIKGLVRAGDHVVSTWLEHNSVLRVLKGLQQRGVITLSLAMPEADGVVRPESVLRLVNRRTRLIVHTQASNVTGVVQPVEELGLRSQRSGIPLLVDAAQACGHVPVDLSSAPIDLYAFPGHKGLLGPQGTGGLWVREGLTPLPLREGGTGTQSDLMYQPGDLPERYESGTLNTPGIAGLLAGVQYLTTHESPVTALTEGLWEGLRSIPGAELYPNHRTDFRSGVVAFNLAGHSSEEIADTLSDQEICVRGGLHCAPLAHRWLGTLERGAVRASLGAFTSAAEVETFLAAVRELDAGR